MWSSCSWSYCNCTWHVAIYVCRKPRWYAGLHSDGVSSLAIYYSNSHSIAAGSDWYWFLRRFETFVGATRTEKGHGTHICDEDSTQDGHVGEGTGEVT